jgi:dTDP-4-dehydrorhamnose reductase
MLRLSLNNPEREIKVVHDQFGSPTWAYSLSEQIRTLIEVDALGTYHGSSEGHCSWYELAEYFLGKMGVQHNVVPCHTKDYPTPAARPKNSILENKRLKDEGISVMPHWKDGIDEFVGKFREPLMNEIRGAL